MDSKNLSLAAGLVKSSYIAQGSQALNRRRKMVTALLSNRRLPKTGWDDAEIEYFLTELALMDSNNFVGNIGVGEREARVYSSLVAHRHYRLGHGVGRSGDVAEVQPKAAGSSLMNKLCQALALDALHVAGMSGAKACLVLPMATGMSLALTLMALRPSKPGATRVVWPRMDQKSCFKAIVTAGFEPVVVDNRLEGDAVCTDVEAVQAAIERGGADSVLCVVTTASCFAPRVPDKVDEVARVCAEKGVGHVINNAYGLQCARTCRLVNRAMVVGKVDAVVQSTDKNFMVPVGGSIVCGPDPTFIDEVGKSYPGRASASPCLDLFVTLLSMGESGYRRLLEEREALVQEFRERLRACARENGERLLSSPGNTISFAITLSRLEQPQPSDSESGSGAAVAKPEGESQSQTSAGSARGSDSAAAATRVADGSPAAATAAVPSACGSRGGAAAAAAGGRGGTGSLHSSGGRGAQAVSFLGSMLFTRGVSGTRVVPRGAEKVVAGTAFRGYGASVDAYPAAYLTAACALGLTRGEVEAFAGKLSAGLGEARNRGTSARRAAADAAAGSSAAGDSDAVAMAAAAAAAR